MTHTPISDPSRRVLLAGFAAAGLASVLPRPALALTEAQARELIGRAVQDVQRVINAGSSEAAVIRDFEGIFDRYGDVPIIARSVLGPPARAASAGQMTAFATALRGYLARKYGRQFNRFRGATAEVTGASQLRSFWEVSSQMRLTGRTPFEVRWHVSDGSGRNLFFNIIIEGVNVLATERQEIGTMLERRGGDLNRLIADLQNAG